MEFTVLRNMGQVKRRIRLLNFRKADFQPSRDIVGSCGKLPTRDKGMEKSWQIFKEAFHRRKELAIPRNKKSGREGWSN